MLLSRLDYCNLEVLKLGHCDATAWKVLPLKKSRGKGSSTIHKITLLPGTGGVFSLTWARPGILAQGVLESPADTSVGPPKLLNKF